jgi:hypothetical protein
MAGIILNARAFQAQLEPNPNWGAGLIPRGASGPARCAVAGREAPESRQPSISLTQPQSVRFLRQIPV